jgi:hypothetical protein
LIDTAIEKRGEKGAAFFESTTDLKILAAQQGVSAVSDFDSLLGDFWPEDESADQFIASVREWRREWALYLWHSRLGACHRTVSTLLSC